MNSHISTVFSRRAVLALVAAFSTSAVLLPLPVFSALQTKFDAPIAAHEGRFDPYTQGTDRQADTYGYLSWKGDRFDPYTQGTDRQADTYGYLS